MVSKLEKLAGYFAFAFLFERSVTLLTTNNVYFYFLSIVIALLPILYFTENPLTFQQTNFSISVLIFLIDCFLSKGFVISIATFMMLSISAICLFCKDENQSLIIYKANRKRFLLLGTVFVSTALYGFIKVEPFDAISISLFLSGLLFLCNAFNIRFTHQPSCLLLALFISTITQSFWQAFTLAMYGIATIYFILCFLNFNLIFSLLENNRDKTEFA